MWREGESLRARLRPLGRAGAGADSEETEEDSMKRNVDSGLGSISQRMEVINIPSLCLLE
jgi:hypothetical protein